MRSNQPGIIRNIPAIPFAGLDWPTQQRAAKQTSVKRSSLLRLLSIRKAFKIMCTNLLLLNTIESRNNPRANPIAILERPKMTSLLQPFAMKLTFPADLGRSVCAWMMPKRYTNVSRNHPICCALMFIGLLLLSNLAPLQAQSTGASESISAVDAIQQFEEVRSWLDDWQTPEHFALPSGCGGAWVGIRWSGRLMGFASESLNTGDETALPNDRILPAIMRKAMAKTRNRASAGAGDAVEKADRDETFEEVPASLQIQFAQTPVRVRGTTIDGILKQVQPGLDGMIIQNGNARHAIFPAEMMLQEQSLIAALGNIRFEMDLTAKEFENYISDGRIRIWKFGVIDVVQSGALEPATIVHAGSKIVPTNAITTESLHTSATALVHHLASRMWPGDQPLGIMGTYMADVDRYDPFIAAGRNQALAAFALAKFATSRRNVEPNAAQIAQETAWKILDDLASRSNIEVHPISAAGPAGMIVLAIRELEGTRPITIDIRKLRALCLDYVSSAYSLETKQFSKKATPTEWAICAQVLNTRAAVDAVWLATPFEEQLYLLPWIGWAEMQLAKNGNQPIQSATGLMGLRLRIWEKQIQASTLDINGHPPRTETLGGLQMNQYQLPNWETARILTFLATMVGDPHLTEQSGTPLFQEIMKLTQAFRFLNQLTMRDEDTYRLPEPHRALHGVRASLLNDRMPIRASAMTLLAYVEMIDSLDAIEQRLNPAPQRPTTTAPPAERPESDRR